MSSKSKKVYIIYLLETRIDYAIIGAYEPLRAV
jgi:hypothetical protein